MRFQFAKKVRDDYYGPFEFFEDFPNEKTCLDYLFEIKYPNGFQCEKCQSFRYDRLKGAGKRARVVQCRDCKKQKSLTADTIFEKTRVSLQSWFYVMFCMSQTKKGKSANQLSKEIHKDETTVLLMMSKIRKSMEENMVSYQIGGKNCVVEADEIEVGGKNGKKQIVLALLEKNPDGKKGRFRLIPIKDKKASTIELALVPLIKQGSTLHTDGNPVYSLLQKRYSHYFDLKSVAHWEENFRHEFHKDINMIIGNFKRWYRGIHHSFNLKNTGFYCNEFTYRL